MKVNPFVTALGVGVGTMVAMGGTTMIVSGIGISIAKRINRSRMLQSATMCSQCSGEGYVTCDICQGTCIVRCRSPKSMSQILKESHSKQTIDAPAAICSCPACGTSAWKRCSNCLGSGKIL